MYIIYEPDCQVKKRTPIEGFQGKKKRLSITYDAKDRVEAINQATQAQRGGR